MSLMLWVRSVKRSKLRGRKITRLSKGHLSMKDSEVSLLSPGVVKAHLFEFPRSNLELQDIIGKFLSLSQCCYKSSCFCSLIWCVLATPVPIHSGEGRFGKVYKGKAYGIVPDAPDLNTVAVKTTATGE